MLMAEINGEADTQDDKEGFDIWQPDWGLIAFSLSGRWLHSRWLFHMSDVFSRWHLISCQVRCGVIRSVTKDDKDDRDGHFLLVQPASRRKGFSSTSLMTRLSFLATLGVVEGGRQVAGRI